MIGDGEIDLTEDLKFGRSARFNSPIDLMVQTINRFPWRKPVPITNDRGLEYGGTRLWGDTLSDEMNGVIRSTFNGGWFIGLSQKERGEHFKYVFQEVLYELGLVKPGWVPCICCGRLHLTANPYTTCGKCEDDYKYEQCYNKLFSKVKYPDRYVCFTQYQTDFYNNIVHRTEYVGTYKKSRS